jgi:PAS domain S-box-containing protein
MLNKYLSLPIRIHFIILVFLLAIPFIGIIVYVGMTERGDALKGAQNDCFKFVSAIAREEQVIVAGIRQLAATVAILPEITDGDAPKITPLLKRILKDNPQYTNITLSDEQGRILASAMPVREGMSVAHLKYFKDTVRTGMFSSGEYSVGRMTNKPILIFGYPVRNGGGRLNGVIGIGIDFTHIRQAFEGLNFPPGSSFSLLDHNGTILYRHLQDNLSGTLAGKRDIQKEIFTSMQNGPEEGTFTAVGNDGRQRIFAYKKMKLPQEAEPYLYIRSSIPESSAIGRASKGFFLTLAAIGLLSFVVLLWAWFIGKRIIVDRVTALEKASKQLAAGSGMLTVSKVITGGDLGELAKAIDRMVATAAEKEATLRTVFEAVNDSLFMIDRNGTVLALNTTTAERFGKRPEEILGKCIYDFLPAPLAEARRGYQEQALRSGGVVRFEDERAGRWIESVIYPVAADQGPPDRFVIYGRDITERKRIEEALRKSEENYRQLFINAPSAIYQIDFRTGKLLKANDVVCEYLGCRQEEIASLNPYDFLTEESKKVFGERLRRMGLGEKVADNPVYEIAAKDGRRRWIQLNSKNILDGEGMVIGADVVAHEITDQRRAEEESRRLASVVRHSLEIINLATPDGIMVFLNDAGKKIFGISEEEIARTNILDVIPEHLRDKVRQEVLPAIVEKGYWEGEIQYLNLKTGHLTDVHASSYRITDPETGAMQYLASVSQDITERKRDEKTIMLHAAVMETVAEGIFLIGLEDNIIKWTNRKLEELFGYGPGEMVGMHVDKVNAPTEKTPTETRISIVDVLRQSGAWHGEVENIKKDGTHFWSYIHVSVFNHPEYGAVMVAAHTDITKRKREEEERVKLQEQFLQSQKMEFVGRLAGGVAHDFNNMLGVILGHVEMAMEQVSPAESLHADLTEIRRAASRSADLTRQLLAFARKQVVTPRVLDLNETVEGMLKMLRRLIGENIHLAWMPGTNLWPVRMDPSQLDQVLANLSVNARDAISGIGKVTIETKNVHHDEAYCADHVGCVPGDYVLLVVSDNGCGMGKEILDKLFEPFFTTKETGKGTGLGLATVYGIVRQNNGFIDVLSGPDQGSTFRIHLPRYLGEAEQTQRLENQEPDMRGQETVLLVEDDPSLLQLTKRMLEKQGYRVLAAATPGEAIRLGKEHAGGIQLLITDVVMPEMNGQDLVSTLHSVDPNLAHLFISGYTADVMAHNGALPEGFCFLQKPFSRRGLAAKVREVLDRKRTKKSSSS